MIKNNNFLYNSHDVKDIHNCFFCKKDVLWQLRWHIEKLLWTLQIWWNTHKNFLPIEPVDTFFPETLYKILLILYLIKNIPNNGIPIINKRLKQSICNSSTRNLVDEFRVVSHWLLEMRWTKRDRILFIVYHCFHLHYSLEGIKQTSSQNS